MKKNLKKKKEAYQIIEKL